MEGQGQKIETQLNYCYEWYSNKKSFLFLFKAVTLKLLPEWSIATIEVFDFSLLSFLNRQQWVTEDSLTVTVLASKDFVSDQHVSTGKCTRNKLDITLHVDYSISMERKILLRLSEVTHFFISILILNKIKFHALKFMSVLWCDNIKEIEDLLVIC